MKESKLINFESFYFIELLENILRLGEKQLSSPDHNELKKLVYFLKQFDDAQAGVVKLAEHPITSDVSIFFSEILEQLRQSDPGEALGRLPALSRDFLEMFKILLQDAEWQAFISAVSPEEIVPQEVPEEPLFSFREFVQHQIREGINNFVKELPEAHRNVVRDFLLQVMEHPRSDLLQEMRSHISHPELERFVYLSSLLSNGKEDKENLDLYIQTLDEQIQRWLNAFGDVYREFPDRTLAILQGEFVVESPPEAEQVQEEEVEEKPAEIPLETLFEEGMETGQERILLDESAGEEIDELVQKAEELEMKKPAPGELSPEELERRKLLRDYLVSELDSCAEEIYEYLRVLLEKPADEHLQKLLLDSLRNTKELGQIHGYPAVQVVADQLTRFFRETLVQQKSLSPQIPELLKSIFQLFPSYIDAVIQGQGDALQEQLMSRLQEVKTALTVPAEELFAFKDEAVLSEALVSVLDRSVDLIRQQFISLPPDQWREQESARLSSILQNLIFWTSQVPFTGYSQNLELIGRILTPAYLKQLSKEEIRVLNDLMDFYQARGMDASEDDWQSWNQRLQQILKKFEPVTAEEALQAFKEVSLKQLQRFRERLEAAPENISSLWNEEIPSWFLTVQDNARVVKQEELADLMELLRERILGRPIALSGEIPGIQESLLNFLDSLQEAVQNLPQPVNSTRIWDSFQKILEVEVETEASEAEAVDTSREGGEEKTLLEKAMEELGAEELELEEDLAKQPTEEEPTKTTAPEITQEEIEKVFLEEAEKYIRHLRQNIETLKSAPEKWDIWKQLSVTAHSLKGSAQMLGRKDIVQLVEPLELFFETVNQKQLSVAQEGFGLIEQFMSKLEESLAGEIVVPEKLVQSLQDQLHLLEEKVSPEHVEETMEVDETVAEVSETAEPDRGEAVAENVIRLSEQDPEMLQIFKEEVTSSLEKVEAILNNLEKFMYDKKAIMDVDQAIHEVRGAAKMLGLSEIGHVMDVMEQFTTYLLKNPDIELDVVIPPLRRGIQVVNQLIAERQIDRQTYDNAVAAMLEIISGESEVVKASVAEKEEEKTEVAEKPAPPPQLLNMFVQETLEHIDQLNYLLLQLEKNPDNEELQHHLMRVMHTIKGSAAMANATHIESLAHLTEDFLEQYIRSQEALPPEAFDLLFSVVDEISFIVDALKSLSEERTRRFEEIYGELKNKLGKKAEVVETEEPRPPVIDQQAKQVEEEPVRVITETEEERIESAREAFIRMNIEQINNLSNKVAELVIGHTQFKNQLERLKSFGPTLDQDLKVFRNLEEWFTDLINQQKQAFEKLKEIAASDQGVQESLKNQIDNLERIFKTIEALKNEISSLTHSLKENVKTYDENIDKFSRLSNELLEEVMHARMVPIQVLFQRFHRPIRDLARQYNKKIRLHIKGENTELDRTIIDDLYDPLLHIIRNAIDHGIETVEERVAAGKDPEGLLEIMATRERNQVIIQIADDGRGIDLDRVREIAVERGLVGESEAKSLSESELLEFLFYPGFSTSKEISAISGRGVGLDVVKSELEKIQGDVRIQTEKGKGTRFTIRVPISIAVTQSMLVEVSENIYSIPLFQVEETLNIRVQDLVRKEGVYYLNHRGREIPVIPLHQLLMIKGSRPKPISIIGTYPVIIVQEGGKRAALLVDKIVRREETLIKSLGRQLRRLKFITGGSIMADGQVVLVLDIPQIVQEGLKALEQTPREGKGERSSETPTLLEKTSPPPKMARKKIAGRKPRVLVVDDSISIRKYVSGLLMQWGFLAETANNGSTALENLKEKEYDLLITDLEMPKVSGYELIEMIRKEKRFEDLPIIVLTGRAAHSVKEKTMLKGANAYIIKPFTDKELYDKILQFIEM